MDGCDLLEAGPNSVTCGCGHLTAFAVLVPEEVFEPLPPVILPYSPHVSVYVVVGCGCGLLLGGLLILACVKELQGVTNTIYKHLFFTILLYSVGFLISIDRTELQVGHMHVTCRTRADHMPTCRSHANMRVKVICKSHCVVYLTFMSTCMSHDCCIHPT